MSEDQRYTVTLLSVEGRPIWVARVIRQFRTDLTPKAAKALTQVLPVMIATDLEYKEAKWFVDAVRGGGGTCSIDPPHSPPEPETEDRQSWLIRQVSRDEAEQSDDWDHLCGQFESGDEVWLFRSPPLFWKRMCGRGGYALVRNGEIIASIVTAVN